MQLFCGREALAVVVAGTGPSFTQRQAQCIEDAQAACKCVVIAINDNYKKLVNADILYAADEPWWDAHHACIVNTYQFRGQLISCNKEVAKKYGVHFIEAKNNPGLSRNPDLIHTGGNSGYQGVGLAYHILSRWPRKERRILLVGFDYQRTGGKAHWFGEHPKGLSRTHPYLVWLRRFPQIVADIQRENIDIINCTIDTALTCMPRGDIENELWRSNLGSEHEERFGSIAV